MTTIHSVLSNFNDQTRFYKSALFRTIVFHLSEGVSPYSAIESLFEVIEKQRAKMEKMSNGLPCSVTDDHIGEFVEKWGKPDNSAPTRMTTEEYKKLMKALYP